MPLWALTSEFGSSAYLTVRSLLVTVVIWGCLPVRVCLSAGAGWLAGEFGAGGLDEFLIGAGVAGQAPAAVGCFGEQDPGPGTQGRIAGGGGHDGGELA